MPTIGWFEILIVVAIAIVILGPKTIIAIAATIKISNQPIVGM